MELSFLGAKVGGNESYCYLTTCRRRASQLCSADISYIGLKIGL